tara:strand:- start:173 stop:415 length:243 start_codon:yes stop_codon:yes gene_type:complete
LVKEQTARLVILGRVRLEEVLAAREERLLQALRALMAAEADCTLLSRQGQPTVAAEQYESFTLLAEQHGLSQVQTQEIYR